MDASLHMLLNYEWCVECNSALYSYLRKEITMFMKRMVERLGVLFDGHGIATLLGVVHNYIVGRVDSDYDEVVGLLNGFAVKTSIALKGKRDEQRKNQEEEDMVLQFMKKHVHDIYQFDDLCRAIEDENKIIMNGFAIDRLIDKGILKEEICEPFGKRISYVRYDG